MKKWKKNVVFVGVGVGVGVLLCATVYVFYKRSLLKAPLKGVSVLSSHKNKKTGKPKIPYSNRITANNASYKLSKIDGAQYNSYSCPYCEKLHIGHSKAVG